MPDNAGCLGRTANITNIHLMCEQPLLHAVTRAAKSAKFEHANEASRLSRTCQTHRKSHTRTHARAQAHTHDPKRAGLAPFMAAPMTACLQVYLHRIYTLENQIIVSNKYKPIWNVRFDD